MTVPTAGLPALDGALVALPAHLTVATTATPSPSPEDGLRRDLDPSEVSPGLLGFVPVFLIALACIGLFLSFSSKIRKVNRAPEPGDPGASAGEPQPGDRPDDAAPGGPAR
jgi:hypothetical protein